MRLRELAAQLDGASVADTGAPAADPSIDEVVYRSDAAGAGTLFACLRGERVDGHSFAADAVDRGAAALLVDRPLDLPVPQIVASDTRAALALIAASLAGQPSRDLAVVGITGTNGKTTSAFLMSAVLEAAGHRAGLLGTVEARVGGVVEPVSHTTPESVDLQALLARMRDAGDTACAMEVSSHALAQSRVAGTRFAAALFTNLTRDHLDYHAGVEEYFQAKRRLFRRPPGEGEDPPGAANLDDPFGRRLAGETGALGYGRAPDADVRVETAELDAMGIRASLTTPRGPLEVQSPLRGEFNLANVAGVVAVGELLALDHGAIARGIAALAGVPGRFEPVDRGQAFQVIVDYAHTPDSLENVLVAARGLAAEGRVLTVFGCGGDRDRGKRPQMGDAARRLSDLAVVTSDNPRSEDPDAIIQDILEGARGGPAEIVVEEDRRLAIGEAVRRARRGDVVVIAGKGHEQGQDRYGTVTPFDDRVVAREVLDDLLGAT